MATASPGFDAASRTSARRSWAELAPDRVTVTRFESKCGLIPLAGFASTAARRTSSRNC